MPAPAPVPVPSSPEAALRELGLLLYHLEPGFLEHRYGPAAEPSEVAAQLAAALRDQPA